MNKVDWQKTYYEIMEGITIRRFALSIATVVLLSGCLGSEKEIRIHNSSDENEQKAEEVFTNDNRLTGAVAVFHKKDVIAAIKVGTFSRFNKAKIEKELKTKLEKVYTGLDVTVSADNKIIMETNKLIKMKDKNEIEKKIEKLKSLLKEET